MKRSLQHSGLALISGVVFGAGLLISGMTRPEKVLGFLDVAGAWDATLMCVMAGAIGVHFWAYRWASARSAPRFAESFAVPERGVIDARLCLGAVLFGVGWGLGGYCPGPAWVSLASGGLGVLVFVATMLLGMWLVGVMAKAEAGPTPSAGGAERSTDA